MPPRRSNPAKRAAEDPIDEVDETKRARPSGWCASAAGMPPAAAASSSRPSEATAMAGAFASSQCSRNSTGTVHTVAADDGDSQPPPPSCMHRGCPYGSEKRKEEGGAGRVLRSLSCPAQHTYCSACLEQMMQHKQDNEGRLRSFVSCLYCRGFEHQLRLVAVSSAAAASEGGPTNADLVRLIPANHSLMRPAAISRPLHRAQGQSSALHDSQAVIRCPVDDCQSAASLWCDTCKTDRCITHDLELHGGSLRFHPRISIAHKLACVDAQRAAVGAKLKRDTADALEHAEQILQVETTDLSNLNDKQRDLDEQMRQLQETRLAIENKVDQASRRVAQLRTAVELLASMSDVAAQDLEVSIDEVLQLRAQPDEVERPAAAIPAARVRDREPAAAAAAAARSLPALVAARPPPVLASDPVRVPVASVASPPAAAAAAPRPAASSSAAPASAPAVSAVHVAVRPVLPLPGLLGNLTAARLADLEGYLHAAGVSVHRRTLLYRASRDGFRQEDFMRMCASRNGTLTIVNGNGYVFGAYIRCAWPASRGTVADPSGQSFVFSLVNARRASVRFSLRDRDHAIRVDHGVAFGADVYSAVRPRKRLTHQKAKRKIEIAPVFVLMCDRRPANDERGVAANDPQRHNTVYQPDGGIVCDESTLGGQHFFAAAEIEVYQLRG